MVSTTDRPSHGAISIISLIVSVSATAILLAALGYAGYLRMQGQATPSANLIAGIVLIVSLIFVILSIVLSIVGIFLNRSKRVFAILALCISSTILISIIVLVFIGIMVTRNHLTRISTLDDQAIKKGVIGSWVDPSDSSDYTGVPSLETFNPDGTYRFMTFTDNTCSTIKESKEVRWDVQHGTLISYLDDGKMLQDRIMSISSDTLVLQSLEDHSIYKRVRAESCAGAAIPKTQGKD